MDIFEEPYYRIIKNFSRVLGQWPYQSPRTKFTITSFVWIAIIVQLVPQIIAIVVHFDDRELLFEAFSAMAIDFACIVKYLNAIYRMDLMKELWDCIRRDRKLLLNDAEKRTLQYQTNLGYFFSTGYAGFAYMTVVIFVTEPILPIFINMLKDTNETIPLRLALPLEYIIIDIEKHYWLILCISNLLVVNITTVIIQCDTTFITFVQHVCGLFAVVGYRLENTPIDQNDSEGHKGDYSLSNSKDVPYKHLVSCIRSHRRALEFAELIEEAYYVSFGLSIGANLPALSVNGYQIITQSHTVQQLLKYASFTIIELLHLFFLCFMSQQLTDMSLEMHESIADVSWYDISVKSQKLLILMTLRSQVPCKLTAAKIMDLSIENFATMLKTCASYLTMLLSMQ
nr:olfactory receptor 77 [Microplitis mediator]